MEELREDRSFSSLTSYVQEHKQKRKEQEELERRERDLADTIERLRDELMDERQKHEALLKKRREETVSWKGGKEIRRQIIV